MFLEKNIQSDKLMQFDSFKRVITKESGKNVKRIFYVFFGVLMVVLCLPWTQTIQSLGQVTSINPDQRPQQINSIIPGKIVKWYVRDGQKVNKGDTLIELGEIKEDYLDESLLSRVEEQIGAKKAAINYYKQKANSATQQEEAFVTLLYLKKNQLKNKLQQYTLQVQSDSIALTAAKNQLKISTEQQDRQQQMYDKGLKSLTDLEQKQQYYQDALAKKMSVENKFYNGKNELLNIKIDLSNAEQEYQEKISKTNGERFASLSQASSSEGEVAKLQNQLANYTKRKSFYYITASQSGQVIKAIKAGIGETVKEGEVLMQILPNSFKPAVEIYAKPTDMPLINIGQKLQLEFDGFPAIVFSGWPAASYGVFAGEIVAIEESIQPNGRFKIWVLPASKKPWPTNINYGTGVKSIALLKDVTLIYELWRQLNGFPAEYYKPKIEGITKGDKK